MAESTGSPGTERGAVIEPDLSRPVPAAWQLKFHESVVAGMSPAERTQWESNPLSAAIPALALVGNRLYANYLGYVFAVNLETGKLVWRSASFHNVEIPASQQQVRMLDPSRFAILASATHLWTLSRDLKDPNNRAAFHLACRRPDTGDLVWQSSDLPDYSSVELVGAPILAGETLFAAGKTPLNQRQNGPSHQYVMAIRGADGKMLWKVQVGTFRQNEQYFYYGMSDNSPQPRLFAQSGFIYVDTHVGVLAKLDAESGEVDWGYGYPTDPVEGSRFFFFGMQQSQNTSASSLPVKQGATLILKGAKSTRIVALDADRMKLVWDRPISKSSRLLGVDDRAVYLGGPELSALDRKTLQLLWATSLPGGSSEGKVLVQPSGIWQQTPRGIFEVDPASGKIRRIFRGDDLGADGGDLYLTEHFLLAVTNRAISAYPSAHAATKVTGRDDPRAAATKARTAHE